jgi:predicted nucleic acid-binding protein
VPYILLDTGIWYAFCDERDSAVAREHVEEIHDIAILHTIIFPWPIAYETLRTRLVRNRKALERFNIELKSHRVEIIDDAIYRDDAMSIALNFSLRGRPMSMVDSLLRLIIEDKNVKLDFFATFNPGDFHDICKERGVEMWTKWK